MDLLDNIFDSGKDKLVTISNSIINSGPVLGVINKKLEKYGTVKNINKNSDGYCIRFCLTGTTEDIKITIKEIVLSEDKKAFSLCGLSADKVWLDNALKDFVAGKNIPLPDNELAKQVLKLI